MESDLDNALLVVLYIYSFCFMVIIFGYFCICFVFQSSFHGPIQLTWHRLLLRYADCTGRMRANRTFRYTMSFNRNVLCYSIEIRYKSFNHLVWSRWNDRLHVLNVPNIDFDNNQFWWKTLPGEFSIKTNDYGLSHRWSRGVIVLCFIVNIFLIVVIIFHG